MEMENQIQEKRVLSFLELLQSLSENLVTSKHNKFTSEIDAYLKLLNHEIELHEIELHEIELLASDGLSYAELFNSRDILYQATSHFWEHKYYEVFYSDWQLNTKILHTILIQCNREITGIDKKIKEFNNEKDSEFNNEKQIDFNDEKQKYEFALRKLIEHSFTQLRFTRNYYVMFIAEFSIFVPEFVSSNKIELSDFSEQIESEKMKLLDDRISKKIPSTKSRLKSLETFCPELIQRLQNCTKNDKKDIIHLITGVNREDSYKLLFTAQKSQINEISIDIDGIDFETLKNKLKNTHLSK
jgi:hypothetical protein